MNRRWFIRGIAVFVVAGFAGCLEDDSTNGDSNQTPTDEPTPPLEVIEQWHTAIQTNDVETYKGIFHSEWPDREYWDDEFFENLGQYYYHEEVEERKILEEDETEVIVEEIAIMDHPDLDLGRTIDHWILRKEDGEWRVHSVEHQSWVDLND